MIDFTRYLGHCSMAQTVDWSGMCNPQCKETTELKFTFLSGNSPAGGLP